MDFEDVFVSWLNAGLNSPIQDEVNAFAFNLYELAGDPHVKFGVELIGAGYFDEDDPDWPCDEVWEPETRRIGIPLAYSGDKWDACLTKMRALVENILKEDGEIAGTLKSGQGVGIGFVDGDLVTAWKP